MRLRSLGFSLRSLFVGSLLLSTALVSGGGCSCDGESDEDGGGGNGGNDSGGGNTGGAGGGTVQCIANLQSIELAPADSTVTLDGSPNPDDIVFTATGTLENGDPVDIDGADLDWSVTREDDTEPGTIDDGVFSPYGGAGGVVTVTATDGCVEASTTVHLFLETTVGQPENPDDWNGPVETTGDVPTIVYPSDQTRFPRNLYRTLFQWYSEGYTEFRLKFVGPNSSVTVYTDGIHGQCADANPTAGCFEVDENAWIAIAGSNAGETATWTVEALDPSTNPPTIRQGAPITMGFSRMDVEGAIFYWSTTSAGIRRGRISQLVPDDYVVGKPVGTQYGDDTVKCVACHVVSRDGKYMAAPTSADTNSLWIYGITEDAPPDPLVTSVEDTGGHGFATISPDDENVVAAWGGVMWMVDRPTGTYQQGLVTNDLEGTHPDWSPLGDELIFATGKGDAPGDSSLARIPWDGSTWGTPSVFLPPPNGLSNLFPMFSPTGEWIVFAQGRGGHGDVTAQLFAMTTDGPDAVELVNANRVTSNQMTDGQYQNSQPTWAPPGDLHWIAFNSKREYGVVLGEGTQQIWVAAVDPSKIDQGIDPSYPAFRVPFQGLEENNHRAYWTLDIGDGSGGNGGGGEGGGGPGCSEIVNLGEPCDPFQDCCEIYTYCDTMDDGATYACVEAVPQ